MDNVIYRRNLVPCSKSSDGDTSTNVIVTGERNLFICWLESPEGSDILKYDRWSRKNVIDFAVSFFTENKGKTEQQVLLTVYNKEADNQETLYI